MANVSWLLGADTDLPALRGLLSEGAVAAVTIGQALHWMRPDALFRAARPLLRPGGGVAVVTNGTPLWLQDSAWSRGLRGFLERWLGSPVTSWCGTDAESQRRYRDALGAAGYEVSAAAFDYVAELTFDQLVGGLYSALSASRLPAPEQRPAFATQVRAAVGPAERFCEPVHVTVLSGRLGG